MIRNIIILLAHDLAVAFKNKTLWLIVCIPLFVYATLTLVDPAKAQSDQTKIVWIETPSHPSVLLKNLERAPDLFTVCRVTNESAAKHLLQQREVDGILMPIDGDESRLRLTVIQQSSVKTLSMLQRLSALQIAVECTNPNWIADIQSLQTDSIKQQTLPIWILMMVLLVSFVVLPAQVADEKEKQLLLGWLQTPIRESEWLAAKLIYGVVLMLTAVMALQWMTGSASSVQMAEYLVTLCIGGFSFGAMGICLGLLCRSQASARTLGVLCYLPLLMPPALSELSQELRHIASLIPSTYFYEPVRRILLENSEPQQFIGAWITLAALGLIACLASRWLIKKRWLM